MTEIQRTITVTVDLAPEGYGEEFKTWCEAQGFNYLGSPRRAWCSEFSSYFRNAAGVAETRDGERFLFYEEAMDERIGDE